MSQPSIFDSEIALPSDVLAGREKRLLGFGFTALDIKALYMGATDCSWVDTRSSRIAQNVAPTLTGTHDALADARYQAEIFRLIKTNLLPQGKGLSRAP